MKDLQIPNRPALAALACAALVVAASSGSLGEAVAAEPELSRWTRLTLEGRKLLFASGRSVISRHPGACGDERELVTVASSARVFGASAGEHLAASLLTHGGARTTAWMEHSPGKKARRARIETDAGLYLLEVFRPENPAEPGELNDWPRTELHEWRIEDLEGDFGPADTYGLIARLGVLARKRQGELRILTKRGASGVQFRTVARERQRHRVENLDTGRVQRVTLDVVGIDLTPVANGDGDTVLNMEGATRVWVEPRSGALVQIEGHSKGAGGMLKLRIASVAYRPLEPPSLSWPGESEPHPCGEPALPERALDAIGAGS
ncbi:MAG: hypothetical protein OEQ13_07460 [Acidobacteriota bacterium]|nr:hypothetical protein [Acidobacteriota bacterium]